MLDGRQTPREPRRRSPTGRIDRRRLRRITSETAGAGALEPRSRHARIKGAAPVVWFDQHAVREASTAAPFVAERILARRLLAPPCGRWFGSEARVTPAVP